MEGAQALDARKRWLEGAAPALALNAGYQQAFVIGAAFALVAGLLGGLLLRTRLQSSATAAA